MVDARKLRNQGSGEPGFKQDTRNHVAHAILANPNESASLGEIHYLVEKTKSTLNGHLEKLEQNDLVETREVDETAIDKPSVFYTLTSKAKEELDEDLLDEERLEDYRETLENLDGYWRYTDDQIRTYLEAERPK